MHLHASRIIIRPAEKEDCPRLLELIHELAEYERAPDEVTVSFSHFVECGFGIRPVWWAYVACIPDGTIVGFALYYVRYSTWKGSRMYLEDIIVTEPWRRKGIGNMLMDSMKAEAKNRGFSGMQWQVLEWNEPAISFYEQYAPRFDDEWINVSLDCPVDRDQ